jgi:dTDP-4-dehydrorhamnose reductase
MKKILVTGSSGQLGSAIGEFLKDKKWRFPNKIDRVYSIEKAKKELNYHPINNFDSFILGLD